MRIAIEEAKLSLRKGNHGFGAVILKDNKILAQTHDTEETDQDPTAHAEINAIRKAASLVGKDLSECLMICTHEPCPMCAGAIIRAKIARVMYGYSIADAVKQGRKRIRLAAEKNLLGAGASMQVQGGVLRQECALLYNQAVRAELKRLRGASDEQLEEHNRHLTSRRLAWYRKEKPSLSLGAGDITEQAYRLLLKKWGICRAEAPVVYREKGKIVFHSKNFCPTLEACRILGLDTRRICRLSNEGATDRLIRQLDPRLRFRRNYEKIRPYSEYCEERIEYEKI